MPMAGKNTAWIWHAMDASPEEANEGEIILEQFAIRFKTPEIATEFQTAFDAGVAAAGTKPVPTPSAGPAVTATPPAAPITPPKDASTPNKPADKPTGKY